MYDSLADLFDRVLSNGIGHNILSLGCGTGSIEWRLASRGYVVTGTDIDAAVVAHARDLCNQKGINVRFEVRDMFQAIKNTQVDAVLVMYTEEPLDRLRILLELLIPTVKTGGLFITNFAVSSSDAIGSSSSYIDIFHQGAPAIACLSAYLRRPQVVRGNEVYLREETDGLISLLSDFTEIPVEFSTKSAVSTGPLDWVPHGWEFRESVDLDAVCPSAAPPFCQQILVVLRRTNDLVAETET